MFTFQNGYYMAKSDELLKLNDYQNLKAEPLYFEYLKNKGFGYSEDINELYIYQIKQLRKDLFQTLENNEVVKLFFYSIDATNTKIIYKHIHHQTKQIIHPEGNINPQGIYNAIKHKDYSLIEDADKFIFEALNNFSGSLKEVSEYIDILYYQRKYQLAIYKELKAYLDVEVTLKNILTVLRSYQIGSKPSLLPFGLIDEIKPLEEFIAYSSNLYIGYLANPLKQYLQDKDLEALATAFSRDFYYILKDYTYDMSGFGIIMLYVYKKQIELENIKTIYYDQDISLDKLVIL